MPEDADMTLTSDPFGRDVAGRIASHLVGEMRDRAAKAAALDDVRVLLADVDAAVADALRLAYLDGVADGRREDSDELVDGRSRSDRAAAIAIACTPPELELFREQLVEASSRSASDAGLVRAVLFPFLEAVGLATEQVLAVHGVGPLSAALEPFAAKHPAGVVDAACRAAIDAYELATGGAE